LCHNFLLTELTSNPKHSTKTKLRILLALFLTTGIETYGGSATWNLNPTSGDWNTAANWTPATVPNGATDVATFGSSNRTGVTLSDSITVNGIVFDNGAICKGKITSARGRSAQSTRNQPAP